MKLKTSAIAMAVAGTLATPMAAQADLYASARIGLENVDTGGISDLRVRSFGSRFGVRSEMDLGNGKTAFGRYEWDVDFHDSDSGGNVQDGILIRHRYVGLKGDFGSVTIGQAYHTYYNHIAGTTDLPWWGAGYAMVTSKGRTDNAITYAGSFGAATVGLTGTFLHESEEDAPDLLEAAVSFPIGDMTLGIGIQDVASDGSHGSAGNDETITGIAISGVMLGDASLSANFQNQDEDDSIALHVGIGNAYVHFETLASDAGDNDPTLVTLGYTQNLGRKTAAYYEYVGYDADTSDSDDDITILRAVLKYDIE